MVGRRKSPSKSMLASPRGRCVENPREVRDSPYCFQDNGLSRGVAAESPPGSAASVALAFLKTRLRPMGDPGT